MDAYERCLTLDQYHLIISDAVVQQELISQYGREEATLITRHILSDGDVDNDVYDFLSEIIEKESEVVETYEGVGADDDSFDINIRRIGGKFWCSAVELETGGFFDSTDEMEKFINWNYGAFINPSND